MAQIITPVGGDSPFKWVIESFTQMICSKMQIHSKIQTTLLCFAWRCPWLILLWL